MTKPQSGRVKSVETVFKILDAVNKLENPRGSDIADSVARSPSTVHNHLQTLLANGFLKKEGDFYRLGLKFLDYGMVARDNSELSKIVQPFLEQMVDQTGEIAWAIVEEFGKGVYLNKAMGDQAVQPYGRIGKRVHLHNIAAGKAILAHMPEERVREIVDTHGLPETTDNTITEFDELLEELERIREQGYALSNKETVVGFRAVGSVVKTDEKIYGAIVVSGPSNRLDGTRFTEEIPELVAGTSNAIELTLISQ